MVSLASSSGLKEVRSTSLERLLMQYLQSYIHSLVYRTLSKDYTSSVTWKAVTYSGMNWITHTRLTILSCHTTWSTGNIILGWCSENVQFFHNIFSYQVWHRLSGDMLPPREYIHMHAVRMQSIIYIIVKNICSDKTIAHTFEKIKD